MFSVSSLNIWCPELFRKLREACRIHFHLVAPLKTFMVPSYDRKNKKWGLKNQRRLTCERSKLLGKNNHVNGLNKKQLEVVFVHFEVWVVDSKVFDVRFSFSMSKPPSGQVLSRFRWIGAVFIRVEIFNLSFYPFMGLAFFGGEFGEQVE